MTKRIALLILLALWAVSLRLNAQDPGFSQFYANQLYLNPAFAGSATCPRIILNYRNQWPGLGSTFVTTNASYDQYVPFVQGGLGLHIMSDQQGDGTIKTTAASGMYSYTLKATRNFSISGGFQAAYVQRKLDWNNLIFPDMIDELWGIIYRTNEKIPEDVTKGYADFSAGVLGFGKNYFVGFAAHHLTQPTESFYKSSNAYLPRKYTLHFGTQIPIFNQSFKRGELLLSPNFMYQRQQDFEQLNYGLYLSRQAVTAGFWFRQTLNFSYDSFILLIGFVQPNFKFAYSYDITVSSLSAKALGAHEISLIFQFPCRNKSKKFNAIKCPEF
jgi:type IX secretion system PorP/SprF family membrane protein